MADAVSVQTLVDGPRNAVLHCTNVSDGTGESAAVKVDMSTLSGSPSSLAIERVRGTTSGMAVDLFFDATANDLALSIPGDESIDIDYRDIGGLQNPKSSGFTGDILASTRDHTANDTYAFTIWVRKK